MGVDAEFLNSIKSEIPKMIKAFANPFEDQTASKKKWNYDHSFDFLYGETIGWIQGYIIRSFIEVYKREPSKEELAEISPDELTPREALNLIYRLKRMLDD